MALLIQKGANVNAIHRENRTALHLAARNGDFSNSTFIESEIKNLKSISSRIR